MSIETEGMVMCPECKGTGKVPPKISGKGCVGCEGCDCDRCKASGKILWIEEIIRKDDER